MVSPSLLNAFWQLRVPASLWYCDEGTPADFYLGFSRFALLINVLRLHNKACGDLAGIIDPLVKIICEYSAKQFYALWHISREWSHFNLLVLLLTVAAVEIWEVCSQMESTVQHLGGMRADFGKWTEWGAKMVAPTWTALQNRKKSPCWTKFAEGMNISASIFSPTNVNR